jgi:elongator complex protein 3
MGDKVQKVWRPHGRDFNISAHQETLLRIFEAVRGAAEWDEETLMRILAQHPKANKAALQNGESGFYAKIELVLAYRALTAEDALPFERETLRRLRMKPVRTSSGVAPVTVLTKPAGCPGRCIFCPDADNMPKSYLPNEPGARRAEQCGFDPHRQVITRLTAFKSMGHVADKVELLILGGTWGAYSKQYRQWFVGRCLQALNEADQVEAADLPPLGAAAEPETMDWPTLLDAQARNESAAHRNVGLVVETRPDWVTPAEVAHMRRLGVTKVQLGVQSLDDRILALNQRGHDVEAVRRAVRLLRAAGFKLHLHWMPNLLGATPESDRADFARLWSDPALQPDELKIYPCSIIEGTELYDLWRAGEFRPYTDEELVPLVADCKATVPRYCRINRVFRDIPADDIVAGSKRSNLRQLALAQLAAEGRRCNCIRCREVRGARVEWQDLRLVVEAYDTDATREEFLAYETAAGGLAGFLRLSFPLLHHGEPQARETSEVWEVAPELRGAALIREVHVYGPALGIGADSVGEAQHLGLGRRLIAEAMRRTRAAKLERLAVISAIGTRRYYEAQGFEREGLYMVADVSDKVRFLT